MQYVPINADAYVQGYDAYARGYDANVNPYVKDSSNHHNWYMGWLQALNEVGEL